MADLLRVKVTADGWWDPDGQSWSPPEAWVGVLGAAAHDRRAALLSVAARARDLALAVVLIDAGPLPADIVLDQVAIMPPSARPRGLLLGDLWQEAAAARCTTLTGAAADLGLADAVRIDDDQGWQGHHLVAGAVEAFLAQIWTESAGPLPRTVILGDSATAVVAALTAAKRGATTVTLVVADALRHDELNTRLAAAVNWPPTVTWQVSDGSDLEAAAAGLWVRATARDLPDALWLPDAAGTDACVLIDLVGNTSTAPLGFAHPGATGVQVMAAGLAAAWYLGPPIPWDAIAAASSA